MIVGLSRRGEGLLDHGHHVFGFFNSKSLGAVTLRQFHEIGHGPEGHLRKTVVVKEFLPLAHHARDNYCS